jgi:putative FmdB family regulatory protein
MPFYEYICDSCESEFERFQKISDDPVKECPDCGQDVRKKIFAPPVILKGAGFYETEYGRSKHNHPDAKKSDGAESTSKAESKSDSSATKTDSGAKKADSGSKKASKDGGKAA